MLQHLKTFVVYAHQAATDVDTSVYKIFCGKNNSKKINRIIFLK
jgi:hypothetical protein